MRRQPPVHSPLTAGSIVRSAGDALFHAARERSALEDELRRRFEADSVILTDSGTHALQLVFERVPAVEEDRRIVALPGYSCFDLVTAAVGARAHVRFYDIDPLTLSPDIDSLRRVLREGVSAVVVGNLYGYPLDWGAIRGECDAAGVVLIEDAAQGIGTVTDDGAGGTLGLASILSFGRGKGWTGGGGGALLLRGAATPWRDRLELAPPRAAQSARTLTTTTAAWCLGRPSLYRLPTSVPALGLGETRYRDPTPPRSIPAFSAALARRTARSAAGAIEGRRRVAGRLIVALDEGGTVNPARPCRPVGGFRTASFLRLPVVLSEAGQAQRTVGVGCDLGVIRGYPKALHRLPQARPLHVMTREELPGSEELARLLVTLPTHEWLTDPEVARILELMRSGS